MHPSEEEMSIIQKALNGMPDIEKAILIGLEASQHGKQFSVTWSSTKTFASHVETEDGGWLPAVSGDGWYAHRYINHPSTASEGIFVSSASVTVKWGDEFAAERSQLEREAIKLQESTFNQGSCA
jgi:hypothetical protein